MKRAKKERRLTAYYRHSYVYLILLAAAAGVTALAVIVHLFLVNATWGKYLAAIDVNHYIAKVPLTIVIVLLLPMLIATTSEVIRRRSDLAYFANSLRLTAELRRVLPRQADTLGESQSKLRIYNYCVRRVGVYVGRKRLIVMLPIPRDAQAQQMLRQQFDTIKTTLNQYVGDDYMISDVATHRDYFVFAGTHTN